MRERERENKRERERERERERDKRRVERERETEHKHTCTVTIRKAHTLTTTETCLLLQCDSFVITPTCQYNKICFFKGISSGLPSLDLTPTTKQTTGHSSKEARNSKTLLLRMTIMITNTPAQENIWSWCNFWKYFSFKCALQRIKYALYSLIPATWVNHALCLQEQQSKVTLEKSPLLKYLEQLLDKG